jgi:hypothetical protein
MFKKFQSVIELEANEISPISMPSCFIVSLAIKIGFCWSRLEFYS